jgi:hypothetical protein
MTLTSKPFPGNLTVEQFCGYVCPNFWNRKELLEWPPDVFAVVASLLLKSGAYCHAISGWRRKPSLRIWLKQIERAGNAWQSDIKKAPRRVTEWHRVLIKNKALSVFEVPNNSDLCDALLRLCAVADEACRGVGFNLYKSTPGDFLYDASEQLARSLFALKLSTLGKRVPHSVLRVLPKLHTPQSGITIRSLTHHLALCPAGCSAPLK